MADGFADKPWRNIGSETLGTLKNLVWGTEVTEEVFLRWTQGLSFSEVEPSALIQTSGGPCAVIAPLQAYILKNTLFHDESSTESDSADTTVTDISQLSNSNVWKGLTGAVLDILGNVSLERGGRCTLVTHPGNKNGSQHQATSRQDSDGESSNKKPKLFSFDSFHEQLEYKESLFENIKDSIDWYIEHLKGDFGVLSLLYSVILTCGLESIKSVVEDSGEPLIDHRYGHGGQCLVNLILTGEATAQVFDGEQDAGGLKLRGISKQSPIGFLSLIESCRLVEVGWNLKSPVHPIWVLASESHLTVLFSKNKEIVAKDKQTDVVRVISSYDTEGNGFISTTHLTDLMSALNLLTEPQEYVEIIREKLDSEGLGIFLIRSFMEEFFPKNCSETRSFELSHYNGIKRSNPSNKIVYHKAKATLKDFSEPTVVVDDSQMLKCLQTKWPSVELEWQDGVIPSLN